jgi:hypothetical protein
MVGVSKPTLYKYVKEASLRIALGQETRVQSEIAAIAKALLPS